MYVKFSYELNAIFFYLLGAHWAHNVAATSIQRRVPSGVCVRAFVTEVYHVRPVLSVDKMDHNNCKNYSHLLLGLRGGGPRVVVSTTAFHARVRGSVPGLGGLKETKKVSPGLEFRILCLEDNVISIISPSSGGSPGPV